VRLTFARQRRPGTLPQVLSADGGRYANGAMEFWIDGTRHDLRAQVPRQSAGPSNDFHGYETSLGELEGSIKESLMAARIPNIDQGNLLTRRSVIGTGVSLSLYARLLCVSRI
jgi:hypothetical protein